MHKKNFLVISLFVYFSNFSIIANNRNTQTPAIQKMPKQGWALPVTQAVAGIALVGISCVSGKATVEALRGTKRLAGAAGNIASSANNAPSEAAAGLSLMFAGFTSIGSGLSALGAIGFGSCSLLTGCLGGYLLYRAYKDAPRKIEENKKVLNNKID